MEDPGPVPQAVHQGGVRGCLTLTISKMCFPGGSEVKASACNAGDLGLIPGSGRFPGEGDGNPLWYSCLGNSMDRGDWWTTVHGVTKELDTTEQLTHTHANQYTLLNASLECFVFFGEGDLSNRSGKDS